MKNAAPQISTKQKPVDSHTVSKVIPTLPFPEIPVRRFERTRTHPLTVLEPAAEHAEKVVRESLGPSSSHDLNHFVDRHPSVMTVEIGDHRHTETAIDRPTCGVNVDVAPTSVLQNHFSIDVAEDTDGLVHTTTNNSPQDFHRGSMNGIKSLQSPRSHKQRTRSSTPANTRSVRDSSTTPQGIQRDCYKSDNAASRVEKSNDKCSRPQRPMSAQMMLPAGVVPRSKINLNNVSKSYKTKSLAANFPSAMQSESGSLGRTHNTAELSAMWQLAAMREAEKLATDLRDASRENKLLEEDNKKLVIHCGLLTTAQDDLRTELEQCKKYRKHASTISKKINEALDDKRDLENMLKVSEITTSSLREELAAEAKARKETLAEVDRVRQSISEKMKEYRNIGQHITAGK